MLIHIIKSNWQVVIACVFDENILVILDVIFYQVKVVDVL